jgi:hypothetical protein
VAALEKRFYTLDAAASRQNDGRFRAVMVSLGFAVSMFLAVISANNFTRRPRIV